MKTETQIAKENIEELILWREGLDLEGKKLDGEGYSKNQDFELISFSKQNEHKASCERFLEFFDTIKKGLGKKRQLEKYQKKGIDLKQAIKLYNEAGI